MELLRILLPKVCIRKKISNANGRFGQFNLELDWSDALIGDPDCIPQNVGAPFTRLDCDFSKDSIQGLVADPTVYFQPVYRRENV